MWFYVVNINDFIKLKICLQIPVKNKTKNKTNNLAAPASVTEGWYFQYLSGN